MLRNSSLPRLDIVPHGISYAFGLREGDYCVEFDLMSWPAEKQTDTHVVCPCVLEGTLFFNNITT